MARGTASRWQRSGVFLVLAALAGGGCIGEIGGPGGTPRGDGGGMNGPDGSIVGPDGEVVTGPNGDVYTRLRPTCVGCHAGGTNLPIFESFAVFETLLAYNTAFVTPGDPDRSELVRLLEGRGSSYRQMPLGSETFAALEARGATQITVAQVRAWIASLVARTTPPVGDPEAPLVRRLPAELVISSLSSQLGLSAADLAGTPYGIDNATSDPYVAMGGPDVFAARRRRSDLSQTFLLTFVPLSQAYCRRAVERGTPEVFADAMPTDGTRAPDQLARVRRNIAQLHLRMLGERATDADVDELVTGVFQVYEPQDTRVAWTAVCAALARHPLWLTY